MTLLEDLPTAILSGTVGSQAYGLATPESDIDTMSVHVEPTLKLVGLHTPPEPTIETKSPDSTSHEIGKFLRLSLASNPNILEFLWLDTYQVADGMGARLVEIREDFLSQAIRDRYLGYAKDQFERLSRAGRFSSVPTARMEKHARHLLRLLEQGMHAWATGEVKVRVRNPAELRNCADYIVRNHAGPSYALDLIDTAAVFFDSAPTPLPEQPRLDRATQLLNDIRIAYL